jgi:outer membrane lipopolysaccharide assembly protein LptE/RlpB
MNMKKIKVTFYLLITAIFLQACSGEGFHLRGNDKLPKVEEIFYVEGVPPQSELGQAIGKAIKTAGSQIALDRSQATVLLQITNLQEGKNIAAYSDARTISEYDIFLRFRYKFRSIGETVYYRETEKDVNVSQIQQYDNNFTLGKAAEEETMRKELRRKAARMILTKLRYARVKSK